MAVYLRASNEFYSYDFRVGGVRHSGCTYTRNLDDARKVEQSVRDGLQSSTALCRAIISRARRKIPAETKSRIGYVYVLLSGYFVKIGHSFDPAERVRGIVTSTPDPCKMLFCFQGSVKLERALHAEFAACHYRREWFFLCGKLKTFIEEFERQDVSSEAQLPTEITTSRVA